MNAPAEKRSHRQHHAERPKRESHLSTRADHPTIFDQQIVHRLLEQGEIRLGFERPADERAIQRSIDLRAGRANRRPLSGIEGAELNAAMIRRDRHGAPKRVDLANQVALADAADGGVAAHLPERLDALREQQGAGAEPRRGERRLGAGVAATDDNNFIRLLMQDHPVPKPVL